MKVALVNDWLTSMGGEMAVLLAIADIYPEAPIYTSVYNKEKMTKFAHRDVRTSYLQRLPFATKIHKMIPMWRPSAFEELDMSEYDLVISSSHAEAKGVITKPNTIHICYCHTPTRYYWSDYNEYKQRMEFGLLNPLAKFVMPRAIHKLRQWDYLAAQRVDHFIANSHFVAKRIAKYYRRDAKVIYPPVDTEKFQYDPEVKKEDFYFTISRLVPYKRMDLLVEAANKAKVNLKIGGSGPEMEKLKKMAGPTVEILGYLNDEDRVSLAQRAKAFLFASEEDFGIVPVEAMACGTPVIVYAKSGVAEIVTPDVGVVVEEQTVDAFVKEIRELEHKRFDSHIIRQHAEKFSVARFQKEMKEYISTLLT